MPRPLIVLTCAAVGTLLTGCSTPTAASGVSVRLTRAIETAPADAPFLYLEGEITNGTTEPFSSGGCTRPRIEIDSLSARGRWGLVATSQPEELVLCIRAYTVDPGQTASFVATIMRPGVGVFPKGQRLRARLPIDESGIGPSAEFALPR